MEIEQKKIYEIKLTELEAFKLINAITDYRDAAKKGDLRDLGGGTMKIVDNFIDELGKFGL